LRAKGYSSSQIASQIPGATRASVIGKADRLGLPTVNGNNPVPNRLASPVKRMPRSHKVRKDSFRPQRPSVAQREAPAEFVPENPVPFLELERHHCRWPAWPNDAPPRTLAAMLFCGAGVAVDASYCEHHVRVSRGGRA